MRSYFKKNPTATEVKHLKILGGWSSSDIHHEPLLSKLSSVFLDHMLQGSNREKKPFYLFLTPCYNYFCDVSVIKQSEMIPTVWWDSGT